MKKLLCIMLLLTSVPSFADNTNATGYDRLIGQNVQTLIQQWGQPDLTAHTRTGDTIYTFSVKHINSISAPGSYKRRLTGTPGPTMPIGNTASALCTLILKANSQNIITDLETRGSQCAGGEKSFSKRINSPYN